MSRSIRLVMLATVGLIAAACRAAPPKVLTVDVMTWRPSRIPAYVTTLYVDDRTSAEATQMARATGNVLATRIQDRLDAPDRLVFIGSPPREQPDSLRALGLLKVWVDEVHIRAADGQLAAGFRFVESGGRVRFEGSPRVRYATSEDLMERERRALALERDLPLPAPPTAEEIRQRLVDAWLDACPALFRQPVVRQVRFLGGRTPEIHQAIHAARTGDLWFARRLLLESRPEPAEVLAVEYDLALLSHLAGQNVRARQHLERARQAGEHAVLDELEEHIP